MIELIENRRKELGLSRKVVAGNMGISASTYYRCVNKGMGFTMDQFVKGVSSLGITLMAIPTDKITKL